jgi:hypothetical protein
MPTVPLNPRFLCYCIAHNLTTEQYCTQHRVEYGDDGPPGVNMLPFIEWHERQIQAWRAERFPQTKRSEAGLLVMLNQDAYDAWLWERVRREGEGQGARRAQ